jgi:hypothetical protein
MLTPRLLTRMAIWAFMLPCIVALTSQLLIWLIPGCNPNPYSVEGCVVFSHSLAAPLLLGLMGGTFTAVVLIVVISLPLSVVALFWSLRSRSGSRGDVA